jgi:hypothetical protein
MAYIQYSNPGQVAMSTTGWANNVSNSTDNVSLEDIFSDWYPAQTAPYSLGYLRGKDIFYGRVLCGTGGSISLSQPYTVAATTSEILIKNMDLAAYNPVIVATPTYPYTFHSWRTSAGGQGTQISTSATLTLTTGFTSEYFYAYFTTTHVTP